MGEVTVFEKARLATIAAHESGPELFDLLSHYVDLYGAQGCMHGEKPHDTCAYGRACDLMKYINEAHRRAL